MHSSPIAALALCLFHLPSLVYSFAVPGVLDDLLGKREPQTVADTAIATATTAGGTCQSALHSMACDDTGGSIVCNCPVPISFGQHWLGGLM